MAFTDQTSQVAAQLTDAGRRAIARSLVASEQFRFRLAGFRVGRGGYDPTNPVRAVPIDSSRVRLIDPVYPVAPSATGTIACAPRSTRATLTLRVPPKADLVDGDYFWLYDGLNLKFFEFDVAGNGVLAGRVQVDVSGATTAEDVKAVVLTAINAQNPLAIVAYDAGSDTITLRHDSFGVQTISIANEVATSNFRQYGASVLVSVPPPGSLVDGETFTVNDGTHPTTTFEFDTDAAVAVGHVAVDISAALSASDVRDAIIAAVNGVGAGLDATASIASANGVTLVHPGGGVLLVDAIVANATFVVATSGTGVAGILDGETLTLDDGTNAATVLEFDCDGLGVTPGRVRVDISLDNTAGAVATRLATAINSVGAGLLMTAVAAGPNVALTNDQEGAVGNVTLSETVVDAGFVIGGMSGGDDGLKAFESLATPIAPNVVAAVCRLGPADAGAEYGLGEIGIYAEILASATPGEVGKNFLFSVGHYPMVAKSAQTTVVLRVLTAA